MARLGHSTPRAALIYQHATEERDRAIAAWWEETLRIGAPHLRPISGGQSEASEPKHPR